MAQIYTDTQKVALRLNACKNCPLARCTSGAMGIGNSCNVDSTVCSLDGLNIGTKTSNLSNVCQRNYWGFTNGTKPGCGCGKK